MVTRQYFVTDLDGTLLSSSAVLSEKTISVITQALLDGDVVSFATARSFVSAAPLVNAISWRYPIILYNGALILDPTNGEMLDGHFVEPNLAFKILETGQSFGTTPFLYGIEASGQEQVLYEVFRNDGEKSYVASRQNDPRFRQVLYVSIDPKMSVIILSFIGSYEQLAPLHDELFSLFRERIHLHFAQDTYLRDFYFLEISHSNANKRDALRTWASLVGCDPSEITVFGDNLNDLGLFDAAGIRIAVANAHKDLKAMADEVISSNDNDGVAAYMESRLKGE